MRRGVGCGWLVFCTACAGVGVYLAARQHSKLTRFRPVRATVVGAEVESRRSRSGTETRVSYYPVVEFEYVVDGTTHSSNTVFPMDVGRGGRWGRRWGRSIVEQFEEGEQTQVYYDPTSPGSAFLIRQPNVFPYIFILLPTILGLVGLVVIRAPEQSMPPPAKRGRAQAVAFLWHSVGVLCVAHYFYLAGSQYDTLAMIVFGGYTLLGVIPLIMGLRSEGLGGRLQAAGWFLIVGAFLGFWIGLCSGWVGELVSDRRVGGPMWGWYGVLIGGGLFALLGLICGKMESE